MEGAPTTSNRQWIWIAVIWIGVGLFDATQSVFSMRAEGMHHAWLKLFFTLLLTWVPWALATPFVLRLGRRYPPSRLRPFSTWFVHLAACVAIDLATSTVGAALEALLNPFAISGGPAMFSHLFPYKVENGLLASLILYAGILAVGYVIDSRERLVKQQIETARLNEQLSKAQLDALRRQVEPHFLFNTLNAIAGLVREERNDAAVDMIVGLSDFLRRVTQDSDRQQVPLKEEMDFLRRYLEIQKLRFAERLQVSVNVPQELLPVQVPSFVLQPLVENAVKHGIAKRAQGGTIRVSASRENGFLTISVYNDGPTLTADPQSNPTGVGMRNLRTRLQHLYGSKFELRMQNQNPDGVEVSVSVPFKDN